MLAEARFRSRVCATRGGEFVSRQHDIMFADFLVLDRPPVAPVSQLRCYDLLSFSVNPERSNER